MATTDEIPARVLIVDDDPLIVETLQEIFAEAGLQHEGAASGAEALEKLATGLFDAVVLDAVMPDLSGPEVLRRLRKTTIERPAIVYFTAYPDISAYDTFLGGADAVLIKPRPSEELVDTVRYLAGKRRSRLTQELEAESKRQRLEQAGRRAVVTEVAARFCHDVRNPLTAAQGYAYSLRSDLKKLDPTLGTPLLTKLDKMEAAIARITDQITEMARLAAPAAAERPDVADVKQGIVETASLLRGAVAANGIRLLLSDLPEGCYVATPSTALLLILRQLVINACEAVMGTQDRWLRLEARRVASDDEHGAVEIRVSDSGSGIAPADRGRIMEAFFRGQDKGDGESLPADAFSHENLGLGLAIARRTAERFGGRLRLEAESGPTQFVLTLPAAPSDDL